MVPVTRAGAILTVLPDADPVQQDEVLVRDLAHDAGGFEEGLGGGERVRQGRCPSKHPRPTWVLGAGKGGRPEPQLGLAALGGTAGAGHWGGEGRPRLGCGAARPGTGSHRGAVALATVQHFEQDLGLVLLAALLVPLDAPVDLREGALAQALTLWGATGRWVGAETPSPFLPWPRTTLCVLRAQPGQAPSSPHPSTQVRFSSRILWKVIWLGMRRGAEGEPGSGEQPPRTISRLDFSRGEHGGEMSR